MTSDRELLELAAKAAGYEVEWREWRTGRTAEFGVIKYTKHEGFWFDGKQWNPLTDDGDALRLAVKLSIDVNHGDSIVVAERVRPVEAGVAESKTDDPYAATRRAIVRAAAEIGRGEAT